MAEPAYSDLRALAEAAADAIAEACDDPFALLGHSMGALVAFEMAGILERRHGKRCQLLVVMSTKPPHRRRGTLRTYELDDDAFTAYLRSLNGTPSELLDHREVRALLFPTIRADFHAVETYRHDDAEPLHCPLVAIGGTDDSSVAHQDLIEWQRYTHREFQYATIDGDHFLITRRRPECLRIVDEMLGNICVRLQGSQGR